MGQGIARSDAAPTFGSKQSAARRSIAIGNQGYPGRRTENPYVRGACEETHVPTATSRRENCCGAMIHPFGPTRTTWAVLQVVGYLGYSGGVATYCEPHYLKGSLLVADLSPPL